MPLIHLRTLLACLGAVCLFTANGQTILGRYGDEVWSTSLPRFDTSGNYLGLWEPNFLGGRSNLTGFDSAGSAIVARSGTSAYQLDRISSSGTETLFSHSWHPFMPGLFPMAGYAFDSSNRFVFANRRNIDSDSGVVTKAFLVQRNNDGSLTDLTAPIDLSDVNVSMPLAIDALNRYYVSVPGSGIQRFDAAGIFQGIFVPLAENDSVLRLQFDGFGNLFAGIGDGRLLEMQEIWKISVTGSFEILPVSLSDSIGSFGVSAAGDLYYPSIDGNIHRYSADGTDSVFALAEEGRFFSNVFVGPDVLPVPEPSVAGFLSLAVLGLVSRVLISRKR